MNITLAHLAPHFHLHFSDCFLIVAIALAVAVTTALLRKRR
jgi:hypothetical protein